MIGMRLEEMLLREKQNQDKIDASLNDPERQSELVQQDEEEDFLDEGNSANTGNKYNRSSFVILHWNVFLPSEWLLHSIS